MKTVKVRHLASRAIRWQCDNVTMLLLRNVLSRVPTIVCCAGVTLPVWQCYWAWWQCYSSIRVRSTRVACQNSGLSHALLAWRTFRNLHCRTMLKIAGPVARSPSECRKPMQSLYLCLSTDRATVALSGPVCGPVTRRTGAEQCPAISRLRQPRKTIPQTCL